MSKLTRYTNPVDELFRGFFVKPMDLPSDLTPQQILMGLMCGNLHLDVPEWCETEWRGLLEACLEPNPSNRPSMSQATREPRPRRNRSGADGSANVRIDERLGQASVRLDQARAVAGRRMGEAAECTQEYVVRNPWKALGVAAFAGLIIGTMLRSR